MVLYIRGGARFLPSTVASPITSRPISFPGFPWLTVPPVAPVPHHSVLTPWVWGQVPSLPKGRHLASAGLTQGVTQPFSHMKGCYMALFLCAAKKMGFHLKESTFFWRRENHSHFQVKHAVFSMEVAKKIGQKEPFLLGTGWLFKSFLSYHLDFLFLQFSGKIHNP